MLLSVSALSNVFTAAKIVDIDKLTIKIDSFIYKEVISESESGQQRGYEVSDRRERMGFLGSEKSIRRDVGGHFRYFLKKICKKRSDFLVDSNLFHTFAPLDKGKCCCSSVVEHFLGKEEVTSSILVNSSEEGSYYVAPFLFCG